ncbi:membrane protease subunits, stomatin/prohibitin homologs [Anaerolinea thermolimosa]|uniref:SPFH domain-containing protein n=1 Tax=Anaerolinea thermolimosa TaxID=229919 RepID=UPI0007867D77|nr:SPFH domain-containing protein [Anaerolinea thermolimosa]GAP06056.1 membrane protease subunits, stomatin/prohibitin homologs [Anaerolinea thermolimosa]
MSSISTDILIKAMVVIGLVLFFLSTAFVRFSTKIVPESKRVVIMRFGKILGSRGPGIVTLIPMIDYAIWVDLQPTFHYKYGNLLTSDNQMISQAVTVEGKVTDPEKYVINVPNLENALSRVIEIEITDIVKSKSRDELMQRRDWLEDQLKDVLYRSSRLWGFEVSKLSIHDTQ